MSGDLYCEQCGREESKLLQRSRWEATFRALYGMYMVTPNELKAVLKVSAWTGHSGVVNKPQWNQRARMTSRREARCISPIIPCRQPRSQITQSQYLQLSSCLQKHC
jgi:hypothetical protein